MDLKIVFVLALMPFFAAAEFQVVNTSLGEVTGLVTHVGYGKALHFLGIRYGKPPVGDLRFKPPQLAGKFKNGHLNATVKGASCSQVVSGPIGSTATLDAASSEDCLFLNIYRPAVSSEAITSELLAVMVWIHGGAYSAGDGAAYDGRFLAVRGGVLVVTINYRLGLLGFVPNSRKESTLGLQDQILALHWVKNNIRQFGGDPDHVTIFGQSAGAQSVSFLTMSPKTKGLFKRAICQSGVAESPFIREEPKDIMDKLRVKVKEQGCSSDDVLQCLKTVSPERLAQWTTELSPMPVPDGEVIRFYSDGSDVHDDVDMIMGLNLGDGGLAVVYTCTQLFTKQCDIKRGLNTMELAAAMSLEPKPADSQSWDSLYDHYNEWYRGPYSEKISLLAADEFATDYTYRIPTNRTASQIARLGRNKVYVYQFNSTYANNSALYWRAPYTKNAAHGEDVMFVFGFIPPTAHNFRASATMVKAWTDFAKGKSPSYKWTSFSEKYANYLLIDDDNQDGALQGPVVPGYKMYFWNYYEKYESFPPKWVVANAPISRGLGCAYAIVILSSFYCFAFKL